MITKKQVQQSAQNASMSAKLPPKSATLPNARDAAPALSTDSLRARGLRELFPPIRKPGTFDLGNEMWKRRGKHGRPPKYDGPKELFDGCIAYFEWAEDNPLYEDRIASDRGKPVHVQIRKMRPYTLIGLCHFLCINYSTWIDWRNRRSDLSEVISWAEDEIYDQKFRGAAVGFFNANLISRDLGLADKNETGSNITVRVIQNYAISEN